MLHTVKIQRTLRIDWEADQAIEMDATSAVALLSAVRDEAILAEMFNSPELIQNAVTALPAWKDNVRAAFPDVSTLHTHSTHRLVTENLTFILFIELDTTYNVTYSGKTEPVTSIVCTFHVPCITALTEALRPSIRDRLPEYIRQLKETLDLIHAAHLSHGDIRTDNAVVCSDRARLIDIGDLTSKTRPYVFNVTDIPAAMYDRICCNLMVVLCFGSVYGSMLDACKQYTPLLYTDAVDYVRREHVSLVEPISDDDPHLHKALEAIQKQDATCTGVAFDNRPVVHDAFSGSQLQTAARVQSGGRLPSTYKQKQYGKGSRPRQRKAPRGS